MKFTILVALLLTLGFSSIINEEKSISVTIYNNNFAMVKDVRSITFDKDSSFLYFTDVSSNIQTQTVTFKPLNSSSQIRVYEQNFERNLINKNSILKKYIQKQIKIYTKLGTTSKLVKGKLLGYNDGYILQTANGIDVFNNVESIEFPQLPDGFFTVPTLNWKVFSKQQVTTDCQVAYRTTGFGWKADYSITLDQNQKLADVGGWVTIDNNSGKKYIDAKLKLIAGDVNTVSTAPVYPVAYMAKTTTASAAPAAPNFSQKSFADYHLYTLSQPVTLNQSSQKQVQFIPKVYNVALRKYHLITFNTGGYSSANLKAQNKIQFKNSKQIGLGIPFPKGTVRVFKRDNDDGSLQFVGEDSIDHTPKDQKITISTGNAFDIITNINSQSRQSLNNNGGYTAKMNMTIVNHKETAVEIQVTVGNYYGDNLSIKWNTLGSELVKSSSSQYKIIIKALNAGETYTAKWEQNYYP